MPNTKELTAPWADPTTTPNTAKSTMLRKNARCENHAKGAGKRCKDFISPPNSLLNACNGHHNAWWLRPLFRHETHHMPKKQTF